jgi:hypothetical protein
MRKVDGGLRCSISTANEEDHRGLRLNDKLGYRKAIWRWVTGAAEPTVPIVALLGTSILAKCVDCYLKINKDEVE